MTEQRYTADTITDDALDALYAELVALGEELGGRNEEARERWVRKQEEQLGIKWADFRAGNWQMDLAAGRDFAAAYVAAASALLGDAPNYSETRLEFDVKIAESPETYTLVVQRHGPGVLTPHEARQRAEAERDRYRAAWQSARERAQAHHDGTLRLVADRETYQRWLKEAEAEVGQWRATFGRDALPGALRRLEGAETVIERVRVIGRRLAAHAAGFQDVLDESDHGPWGKTVGADIAELTATLDGTAQPTAAKER
ncbi:hypothetical protein ACFWN1_05715 [Streptomyces sp. NPDC058459]|uniref:hypothetical protein n=1 Tax=Streptomyces sp. NPDC058459 TaxID=3346508 RepID=UPI00364D134D